MATSSSPSTPQQTPLAVPPPAPRRFPSPCWSNDDTVALIQSYRDKWYSLRRGNLRATHWQEVADGVAARCPSSNPPKTSVQCRHKMEKLRKRYRAEIRRIGNTTKEHKYMSSWVHFKIMDSMELGFSVSDLNNVDEDCKEEEEDDDDELMLYPRGIKQSTDLPISRRYEGSICNGAGDGIGVRVKIPNSATVSTALDDYPPPVNAYYGGGGGGGGGGGRSDCGVVDEMVAAIEKLGDVFVKMEKMKMDMVREFESMRMKMEMKRSELILESQRKLLDSCLETVMGERKKMKRMHTLES